MRKPLSVPHAKHPGQWEKTDVDAQKESGDENSPHEWTSTRKPGASQERRLRNRGRKQRENVERAGDVNAPKHVEPPPHTHVYGEMDKQCATHAATLHTPNTPDNTVHSNNATETRKNTHRTVHTHTLTCHLFTVLSTPTHFPRHAHAHTHTPQKTTDVTSSLRTAVSAGSAAFSAV